MDVMYTTIHPPRSPRTKLRRTRRGLSIVTASTLGSTRNDAEFTPIISIASICSVMRMLPSSDAMFEPIFPARIRATIVEQNSRMRLSLTMYPTSILSRNGLFMFEAVCITRTPPMKTEITDTSTTEDTMSLSASRMNCFQKIFHFSGFLKTIFRNRKYCPVCMKKSRNIFFP